MLQTLIAFIANCTIPASDSKPLKLMDFRSVSFQTWVIFLSLSPSLTLTPVHSTYLTFKVKRLPSIVDLECRKNEPYAKKKDVSGNKVP